MLTTQFEMLRASRAERRGPSALGRLLPRQRMRFLSSPFDDQSADMLENWEWSPTRSLQARSPTTDSCVTSQQKNKPHHPLDRDVDLSRGGRGGRCDHRAGGNRQLYLLHCVTEYPAPFAEVNLRAMLTLADALGFPVGYSDHTPGSEIAVAAVALGARIVEKHFTLSRNMAGPDHRASLEPQELKCHGPRDPERRAGARETASRPRHRARAGIWLLPERVSWRARHHERRANHH